VEGFPPQCLLQAVGDKSWYFPAQSERPFSYRGIEGHGPIDDLDGRFLSTDHFNQGNEIGGIEGMSNHYPFRVWAFSL
jgi:hypothetical protein